MRLRFRIRKARFLARHYAKRWLVFPLRNALLRLKQAWPQLVSWQLWVHEATAPPTCQEEADHPVPATRRAWLWYHLAGVGNALVCAVRGHDKEDFGWGVPASGCIAVGCKRCGYDWPTHWLY